ncbi:hypothetical protein KAI92_01760 [Candidatus Parcubacteria bacterium]|nr:hypothetical protein [Candidatus Parcubacteria bacterium]
MNNFIKNNFFIFLVALVVGFLVILPTIFSIYKIGFDNFNGVFPIFNDDEIHYLAMAEEVYEGNGLGNVFLGENKHNPSIQPDLVEKIFSVLAKTFHISIPAMFALNDFLFVFVGFLILYLLFLNITRNKVLSLFSALFFYLIFLFNFGRPINPQFSIIFLYLGLYFIWDIFIKSEKNNVLYKGSVAKLQHDLNSQISVNFFKNILANITTLPKRFLKKFPQNLKIYAKTVVWRQTHKNTYLGIIVGSLVYMYPYYWTSLFVLYFINVLFSFLKNRMFLYEIKRIAFFILPFLVLIIPYLLNYKKATAHPYYNETISRFGMLDIHLPGCYYSILFILFALITVFLSRKIINGTYLHFAYSLLISAIILNWQNIITGKYLQFSSHYYQVTILFVVLSLVIIIYSLFNLKDKLSINNKNFFKKYSSIILLILLIIGLIVSKQKREIYSGLDFNKNNTVKFEKQQEYKDVFNWMNKNTKKDSVVFPINDQLKNILPVYTHNNIYSTGYAAYYLMSDEELEDRWVINNYFNTELNKKYIVSRNRVIWGNKFIDKYQNAEVRRKLFGYFMNNPNEEFKIVPDEYINRVFKKFNNIQEVGFENALKKYKVDYILLEVGDKDDMEIINELNGFEFIEEVVKFGDSIYIFKLNL